MAAVRRVRTNGGRQIGLHELRGGDPARVAAELNQQPVASAAGGSAIPTAPPMAPPTQPAYTSQMMTQPLANPSNPYAVVSAAAPAVAPPISPANYLVGILLGVIAGVAGAFVWNKVVIATQAQSGYVAVGVGFLVGMAVLLGTKQKGVGPGIVGAVISLGAMLLGQYLIFNDVLTKIAAENNLTAALDTVGRPGFFFAISHMEPMDWLFIAIGVYAGFRTPAGRPAVRR